MVNLYDGLNLEDFNYWYRDAWQFTKRLFHV